MKELKKLFENNKKWREKQLASDPLFFESRAESQSPKYLWIGCSDSRIPPNEIVDLPPGEMFVHRNIANLFTSVDLNALSVLQFAVDHLKVEHVIVCGHYGCGGVKCAMQQKQFGIMDNWIQSIRDIYDQNAEELEALKDQERYRKLIELNVQMQVYNICHTTIVQKAWSEGKKLVVHGWVYDLASGMLHDLNCCISSLNEIKASYKTLHH